MRLRLGPVRESFRVIRDHGAIGGLCLCGHPHDPSRDGHRRAVRDGNNLPVRCPDDPRSDRAGKRAQVLNLLYGAQAIIAESSDRLMLARNAPERPGGPDRPWPHRTTEIVETTLADANRRLSELRPPALFVSARWCAALTVWTGWVRSRAGCLNHDSSCHRVHA